MGKRLRGAGEEIRSLIARYASGARALDSIHHTTPDDAFAHSCGFAGSHAATRRRSYSASTVADRASTSATSAIDEPRRFASESRDVWTRPSVASEP